MIFREAKNDDFIGMHKVRVAVKENALSNPDLITKSDYVEYISTRGKGWVCEIDNEIVGFSIIDLKENNVWALFVDPAMEKKGIGKQLHQLMLDWYFTQTQKTVWLSTTPLTRADAFYRQNGWKHIGSYEKNEIKFEMTYEDWVNLNKNN